MAFLLSIQIFIKWCYNRNIIITAKEFIEKNVHVIPITGFIDNDYINVKVKSLINKHKNVKFANR